MSIASAQAFVGRMKTNQDFAKKVASCPDRVARLALVNAEGFTVTASEIREASKSVTDYEIWRMNIPDDCRDDRAPHETCSDCRFS